MKFKKGNIVKISDTGCIYPSYEGMAKILGADIDGGKWSSSRKWGSGGIKRLLAEVLNTAETDYVLIEIIDNSIHCGEQYVISSDGLKLDNNASKILSDDLFEI